MREVSPGDVLFAFVDNLIASPVASPPTLARLGLDVTGNVNVGSFTAGQRAFLEFHRDKVLLKAAR